MQIRTWFPILAVILLSCGPGDYHAYTGKGTNIRYSYTWEPVENLNEDEHARANITIEEINGKCGATDVGFNMHFKRTDSEKEYRKLYYFGVLKPGETKHGSISIDQEESRFIDFSVRPRYDVYAIPGDCQA